MFLHPFDNASRLICALIMSTGGESRRRRSGFECSRFPNCYSLAAPIIWAEVTCTTDAAGMRLNMPSETFQSPPHRSIRFTMINCFHTVNPDGFRRSYNSLCPEALSHASVPSWLSRARWNVFNSMSIHSSITSIFQQQIITQVYCGDIESRMKDVSTFVRVSASSAFLCACVFELVLFLHRSISMVFCRLPMRTSKQNIVTWSAKSLGAVAEGCGAENEISQKLDLILQRSDEGS